MRLPHEGAKEEQRIQRLCLPSLVYTRGAVFELRLGASRKR